MNQMTRFRVRDLGEVLVLEIVDRKLLDETLISTFGQELFEFVDANDARPIVLSFKGMDFLSAAANGKLITADKKVKARGRRWKFCHIRPEIYEVFYITRLHKLFDIHDTEEQALAALQAA